MKIFKNSCIACCILLFIHKIKSTYEEINTVQKQPRTTYKNLPTQNAYKPVCITRNVGTA
ncbi:hypothetical protein NEIG_02071 [Nematocida sp. ERTm5]|nr:hypothetical protein NEIG_02071 [Nematocida sp. ERTm5]